MKRGQQRVLDDIDDYVVRFAADGSLLFANERLRNCADIAVADVLNGKIGDISLYGETAPDSTLLRLTPADPVRRIVRIVESADRQRWIEWVDIAVDFDQLHRPTIFQSTGHDITHHVAAAKRLRRQLREARQLYEQLTQPPAGNHRPLRQRRKIVCESSALKRILTSIERVAATGVPVLITGETGTGKDIAAEAVHAASPRADAPLIKVNCAALPANLVESELFGHVKGAFTGAVADRIGRFEAADGGTLFLDEIGELQLDTQAKLLRAIEHGSFERLGDNTTKTVDARIVAATNRNLSQEVRAGRFREDLYWRLNVFPVQMPPLRERPQDIPALARLFLDQARHKHRLTVTGFSDAVLQRMLQYNWPGNVRELLNVVERAAIAAARNVVDTDDIILPKSLIDTGRPEPETLEALMSRHILRTLEDSNWVIGGDNGAARRLGLNESTLRSRMRRLGIERR